MTEKDSQEPEDKLPERPIECSECKKEIAVRYTEIVKGIVTETCMCNECPELQRRLRGFPSIDNANGDKSSRTGLACGNCSTTLESVQVGHPLGCPHCYEVFAGVIISELKATGKIPNFIDLSKKTTPIHIGRSPGEAIQINPSLRLLALNEALNETLKREDYEQAAMIRDQINELTGGVEEKKPKEDNNGKQ